MAIKLITAFTHLHGTRLIKQSKAAGFMVVLLLATVFSIGTAHAQVAPPAAIKDIFPDPALAAAVDRALGKYDVNAVVTENNLAMITSLEINNPQSFAGSEYLPNLKSLRLSGIREVRQFESLPTSLLHLDVSGNQLTQLPDTLPVFLTSLDVARNQLTRLPTLPASLKNLDASDNQLALLPDTLPVSLTSLNVGRNQLTRLPTLPASLYEIDASKNQLTRLPDTLPDYMRKLYASSNQLTQLPNRLPVSLNHLDVGNNQLTQLSDTLPASLGYLNVNSNQLSSLPTLPASLRGLNANDNQLTQLSDTLPASLYTLGVSYNRLTRLPDTLPASLTYLYITNNQLTQLPDTLPASLYTLEVRNNQLTRLPDTLPASLGYFFDVSNNQLTQLPDTLPASLGYLDANNNQLTRLPDTLHASLRYLNVSNNQLTQLPDMLPASLESLNVSNNRLTHLPDNLLNQNICDLNAGYNQLVQYPWPVPARISKPCYFDIQRGEVRFSSDNARQWVTLPTLSRSLGSTFNFDDFAPPILQHFKTYSYQSQDEFPADSLANKGQWTLTTPTGNTTTFAAGDGSEINNRLFPTPGLYQLSFEVTRKYDNYFNLIGSTYTRAIIIDNPDPQAHQTIQVSAAIDETDKIKTVVYADFSPQADHLDQEGALFVFTYVLDTLLVKEYLHPDRYYSIYSWPDEWRLFTNCSSARPVYKGKIGFLRKIVALTYIRSDEIVPALAGAELYLGYGMGETPEQACLDLVINQRFQKIYTMP